MCDEAPMPPCACLILLAFFFTYCTNSRRFFAGKSLRVTTTAGACAVNPIGVKSRSELYLIPGVSTGAETCEPMLPASKV